MSVTLTTWWDLANGDIIYHDRNICDETVDATYVPLSAIQIVGLSWNFIESMDWYKTIKNKLEPAHQK